MMKLLAIFLFSLILAVPSLEAKKKPIRMKVPQAQSETKGRFGVRRTVVSRRETSAERWSAIRSFKQKNPCPANGAVGGFCPGYNLDYIRPLDQGGKRSAKNLQWRPIEPAN